MPGLKNKTRPAPLREPLSGGSPLSDVSGRSCRDDDVWGRSGDVYGGSCSLDPSWWYNSPFVTRQFFELERGRQHRGQAYEIRPEGESPEYQAP